MRWQRGLNAKLRPHGLTQPQFAILAVCGWLGRDGRHTTQQDVATFLGLDRMLVSQIASRLERQGLIDRQVSSGDQRAKCITLTRQGTTVLERALPVVESFDAAFFRDRT
ncbi:MAG: MarR family transcriptional regulator [Rhodobacter sp.]|nr:MarR family transcriptional regulator [Rhodobacter sp.]MCA3519518.1 MarR family transcriptional regulator [Rhodobacter sp.]MCA3524231.1 MarR family transcriptional regulator [Rhodobacter sp.]MCA3526408.1 MarR family transcriptional regulator [Rhodobacter sp.]MCA3529068.1 MarR family transcriptional regulator [Rhodobacter sp.]